MDAVANEALQSMEGMIDELPLLPQVLVRILQLDPDSDNYFEEFGKLTKEDPAFAVRVIALANSSASAPAVQRVFLPTKPNEVSLWQHSVYTAFAAAQIAETASELEVDPAEAYLIGLLHDIGRFVMFEHAAPNLLKVDESQWETPEQLIEADVEVYKFTHSELGSRACSRWQLPESICEAIRLHHTPIEGEIAAGSCDALLFCLQVADRLSLSLLQQDDFKDTPADVREQRVLDACLKSEQERALLSADTLCAQLDRIHADSQDLLSGLGFD